MNIEEVKEFVQKKQSIRNIFTFGDKIKLLSEEEIKAITDYLNNDVISHTMIANSKTSINCRLLYYYVIQNYAIQNISNLTEIICNYNNIINEILDFDFSIEHSESEIIDIRFKLLQLTDDILKENLLFLLDYTEVNIGNLSTIEVVNTSNNILKILKESGFKKILSVIYKSCDE